MIKKLEEYYVQYQRRKLLCQLEAHPNDRIVKERLKNEFGLDIKDERHIEAYKRHFFMNTHMIQENIDELKRQIDALEVPLMNSLVIEAFRKPLVIAATCVGISTNRVSTVMLAYSSTHNGLIDCVIIDEASKANRAETLIPLSTAKKAIIVGDNKQLPPYKEYASMTNYAESLFENLLRLEWLTVEGRTLLATNYRSHPNIAKLISSVFYGGELVSKRVKSKGIGDNDAAMLEGLLGARIVFIDHHESELRCDNSWSNEAEATIVASIVKKITSIGISSEKLCIITPYKAQIKLIRRKLGETGGAIEVETVDSYQGRENTIIIVSMVRSNEQHAIGFLKDRRRLNVTLSRAEDFLIVVGNSDVFSNVRKEDNEYDSLLDENFNDTFRKVLASFEKNGLKSDWSAYSPGRFE